MTRPLTEFVCEDCMDADHVACRRQGGWPFQDVDDRCGCHLTDHRLDNREPSTLCEPATRGASAVSRLTGLMPAPAKALIALVVLWALMAVAVVVVVDTDECPRFGRCDDDD